MGWFNVGAALSPFFTAATESIFPLLGMCLLLGLVYTLSYRYYVAHAYLEELGEEEEYRVAGQSFGLFPDLGWRESWPT